MAGIDDWPNLAPPDVASEAARTSTCNLLSPLLPQRQLIVIILRIPSPITAEARVVTPTWVAPNWALFAHAQELEAFSVPTFCTAGAIDDGFALPCFQEHTTHSLTRLSPSLAGKSSSQGSAAELEFSSFHSRLQRRPRGWGELVKWVLDCEVSSVGDVGCGGSWRPQETG